MNTSKEEEYGRAKRLIAEFCAGDKYLQIDGKNLAFDQLTPEQQGRFSLAGIHATEDTYHAQVVDNDQVDRASTEGERK